MVARSVCIHVVVAAGIPVVVVDIPAVAPFRLDQNLCYEGDHSDSWSAQFVSPFLSFPVPTVQSFAAVLAFLVLFSHSL